MQWLSNLRTTVKLVLCFLIVAAAGALIGGLGLFHMGRISAKTESLYNHAFLPLKNVEQANIELLVASRAQIRLLSAGTLGERKATDKAIQTALAGAEARMADARSMADESAESSKLYQQYLSLMPGLKQRYEAYIVLVRRQSLDTSQFEGQVSEDSERLVKDSRAVEKVLEDMVARSDRLARSGMEEALDTYRLSHVYLLSAALVGVAISVALGFGVAHLLGRQLGGEPKYAVEVVGSVASGDLTVDVRTRSADRASLLYSIKQMQQKLTGALGRVKASSDEIANASQQIAAGNPTCRSAPRSRPPRWRRPPPRWRS